ncbi:MAG: hypothetical protein P4L28_03195 [Paludibacteraceae bacterium]|nr:hypothetical protein [Paludibacteraceae bacterium]
MKKITQQSLFKLKVLLVVAFIGMGNIAYCASMYGDYIFEEDFGTGTDRVDISGLGQIGGLYKYEGPVYYVYALDSTKLVTFISSNTTKTYVTKTPTWHEVPISTSTAQYTAEPSVSPATFYYNITSWKNRTFSAQKTDFTTQTLAARDNTESNIPCSWVKIGNTWHFGFYYITYSNTSYTKVAPDDGEYAIINNLDNLFANVSDSYLQSGFKDHTGFLNDSTSPMTNDSARTAGYNGRMLFVNCSATSGVTGVVYKRQVTELCKDAQFEFTAWVASVHKTTNGSQFRFEFWSADPGDNPDLGALTSAYEGMSIAEANGSTLLKVGDTESGILGSWKQLTSYFTLKTQDYVWVILRNYGSGGTGNDICLDDIKLRAYSPFNLAVNLANISYKTACEDGLVTLISTFDDVPTSIDISQYGFYIQGYRNNTWVTLGNGTPLQTESASEKLEQTLTLSEYNLYSKFRLTVATTPASLNSKCITFTYPPADKVELDEAPAFVISGKDICDTDTAHFNNYTGTFYVTNTNQQNCKYWEVKVKMPDGTIKTLHPAAKTSCDILSTTISSPIPNDTIHWKSCTTSATVTNLPTGVLATPDATNKRTVISGTPTVAGFYTYTFIGTGCTPKDSTVGNITVSPAAQNITLTGTIAPIVINWDANTTAVTVTGLPAGVSVLNDATNKKTTISGTPTAKGTYNYRITTTPNGTAINSTIVVN